MINFGNFFVFEYDVIWEPDGAADDPGPHSHMRIVFESNDGTEPPIVLCLDQPSGGNNWLVNNHLTTGETKEALARYINEVMLDTDETRAANITLRDLKHMMVPGDTFSLPVLRPNDASEEKVFTGQYL